MAKILIVDDAAFMRGSLKYIVEGAGHSVVGMAKDGQEALKLCGKLKPDIVTLDILMSGMDGLTALEAITKETDEVEADAFWEEAVSDPTGYTSPEGEALTYEQAKKLGLLPDAKENSSSSS